MFRGGGADIMRHLLLVIVIIFDYYPPQPPFLAQAISSTLSLLAPLLPPTVQLTLYRRTPTYVPGRDVTEVESDNDGPDWSCGGDIQKDIKASGVEKLMMITLELPVGLSVAYRCRVGRSYHCCCWRWWLLLRMMTMIHGLRRDDETQRFRMPWTCPRIVRIQNPD